jgi:hypothetical protein
MGGVFPMIKGSPLLIGLLASILRPSVICDTEGLGTGGSREILASFIITPNASMRSCKFAISFSAPYSKAKEDASWTPSFASDLMRAYFLLIASAYCLMNSSARL